MEDQEKASPQTDKKEQTFVLSSVQEIGNLVNYLEDYTLLEFAEPVQNSNEQTLVQKGATLRISIFKNLKMRKPAELPPEFVFKYSPKLQDKYISIVQKKLYACLEPGKFHIASQLMSIANIDYRVIAKSILKKRELLDVLVAMDKENDPLLEHLGEIAITTAAFADHFWHKSKTEESFHDVIKLAFSCGLLHDISMKGDHEFLEKDIKKVKESDHERESRDFVKNNMPDLDPRIATIISKHHRTTAIYADATKKMLSADLLVSECLNFTEFFLIQYRSALLGPGNEIPIEKIFFTVGQTIGKGYFHDSIMNIMSRLQRKLQALLEYGQEIGKLEDSCLHKKSAVAYPTPRCTQVLCKDKITDCDYLASSMSIKIVNPTKLMGWAGMDLIPGEYPKCKLEARLPIPPKVLDTITK